MEFFEKLFKFNGVSNLKSEKLAILVSFYFSVVMQHFVKNNNRSIRRNILCFKNDVRALKNLKKINIINKTPVKVLQYNSKNIDVGLLNYHFIEIFRNYNFKKKLNKHRVLLSLYLMKVKEKIAEVKNNIDLIKCSKVFYLLKNKENKYEQSIINRLQKPRGNKNCIA